MSNFRNSFRPGVKGAVRGIADTTRAAASAVHRKPVLSFSLPGQVVVDGKGNIVESGDESQGSLVDVTLVYHLRIDPKKKRPEHQNRVQASRDRVNAAQRTNETATKIVLADQVKSSGRQSRADLPDADLLVEIYEELDAALDEKLLALACTDENGMTEWDYTDSAGNPVNLTAELLKKDVTLAEALQTAVANWERPTKPSLEDATPAKTGDTTKPTTPKTPEVLSFASDTPFTAPENDATD